MTKPRKRSFGIRLSALIVAAALAVLISTPAPTETDAGWIDPEYASAGLTTIPVPSLDRPSCVMKHIPVTRRYTVTIEWTPPAGGLPSGMLYEIRANNIPANPSTQKSVFQTQTSFLYSDDVGGGNDLPDGTNLSVQVFVVIPNSLTAPTTARWQSLNPPNPRQIFYEHIDSQRGTYSCVGN